jgi:hypothetical protein
MQTLIDQRMDSVGGRAWTDLDVPVDRQTRPGTLGYSNSPGLDSTT